MQYTIETRELTNEYTHRPAFDVESRTMMIEASNETEALDHYVRQTASELVSLTRPPRGAESIATVKKEDAVYLVRVYAA